jgi:hypothetical protein
VRDRAADRPAVPHLRIAHLAGDARDQRTGPGEDRVEREVVVPAERADRDPVAVLTDVAEVVEPPDVDEQRRPREPEPQQRDQRVAAREHLRVLAAEQLDRFGDRSGARVLEGGRDHVRAPAAACTARTMFS